MQISGDEAMRYDHFSMLPELAFQPRNGRYGMTLEGGKGGGGSAPAPDPNIGLAQKELAEISREYLNNWKTEVWPTLKAESEKQQLRADEQFALDREIQTRQKEIADIEYGRRQELFFPIEERQISEAMAAGGEVDQERQAALAMGDVRAASTRQQRDIAMQQQGFGIDPTSGRFQGMQRAAGIDTVAMEAAAANRARTAAEQLGWAKRMDALALGAGQFGNQATSTGLSLSAGNQALMSGQVPIQNAIAQGQSMGGAYGGAMQGWGQVGSLGVQKYQADVNAYQAQQQAQAAKASATGSTLGSLAGAAAYYAKPGMSDIHTKENIEIVGAAPNGLTVYEFEYKSEFKDHPLAGHGRFRGFMAQEVEQVFPEAVFTMDNGYKAVDYSKVRHV
jgi:hypothetical protein